MGRPPSGLEEYREWQRRLDRYKESELNVGLFCLQKGVSKSTFHRWARQLRNGVPGPILEEQADRERAETGEAVFLPITLKASPVEIELPNGGIVRFPLSVGQAVLVDVIGAAGRLRPWKAPKS
jgi:hypothetical protein